MEGKELPCLPLDLLPTTACRPRTGHHPRHHHHLRHSPSTHRFSCYTRPYSAPSDKASTAPSKQEHQAEQLTILQEQRGIELFAFKQSQWQAARQVRHVKKLAALERSRRHKARLHDLRQQLEDRKNTIIWQQEHMLQDEYLARKGFRRQWSAFFKEACWRRWVGKVDIITRRGIADTVHDQHAVYMRILVEELSTRETLGRRRLVRIANVTISTTGEAERMKGFRLLKLMEMQRRFKAEQEAQVNKMLNSENQERESVLSKEIVDWMTIEKVVQAYEDDLRMKERARWRLERQIWEEQQREFAMARQDFSSSEAHERPKVRVLEAEERLDIARLQSAQRKDAAAREAARVAKETEELMRRHHEERLPLQSEEADVRLLLIDDAYEGITRLREEYQSGAAVLLVPVTLTTPPCGIYVAGMPSAHPLSGMEFAFKQKYNPHITSSWVQVTVDIEITDGYLPGDDIRILAPPDSLRRGYPFLKIGALFAYVTRVAMIHGRAGTQGPFPPYEGVESAVSTFTDRLKLRTVPTETGNRYLRVCMNIRKERDVCADVQALLQRCAFMTAQEEWTPETPMPSRTLRVAVTLGMTPSLQEMERGLRVYRCVVERDVKVDALPPLLYVPIQCRHLRYELRMVDGLRTHMDVMPALTAFHPERDASSSTLSITMTNASEGDRLILHSSDLETRVTPIKPHRLIVQYRGVEICEFTRGTLQASHAHPCFDVSIRFNQNISQWKVGVLLRALSFISHSKTPPRPRRNIRATYTEYGSEDPVTLSVWINITYPEDIGPNVVCLGLGPTSVVVWRSPSQSPDSTKYIEPAITQVAPEGFAQNQHSIGVAGCETPMFKGGSLTFRVEQGVQADDTLLLRPRTADVVISNERVVVGGVNLAKVTNEVGGLHSSGTYEGATSAAWLKIEFLGEPYGEDSINMLIRMVCFTNNGPTHMGVRWISVSAMLPDPLMPAAPPARDKTGVRVCLPIMTAPSRYLSQKYIENEGLKRFGQFELPEPVFKDDELVSVYDGGTLQVEIMEGLHPADALGICQPLGKEFEIVTAKHDLLTKLQMAKSQFAYYTPHRSGSPSLLIRLGKAADRKKWLDTTKRSAAGARVRKKELLLLFRNLYYLHDSDDPSSLKKVVRVTVTDTYGAVSQVVLEINIQPINDKTVVTLKSCNIAYRQGSHADLSGFRIAPEAVFTDPDTAEFSRGGYISAELSSGGSKLIDKLSILHPDQQRQYNKRSGVRRPLVTLGAVTGSDTIAVLLGGLVVGTLESKVGKLAVLKINIHLKEPWPGWDALLTREDYKHRKPSHSDQFGTRRRRSSVKRRGSVVPLERRRTQGPGQGLPLSAAAFLLQNICYTNTASGAAVKAGNRMYTVKVNAGDDVTDTRVKIVIDVQPPLLSIPIGTPSPVVYTEGSEDIPLCGNFKLGLDQKAMFKRGWLSARFTKGWCEDQDSITFHDIAHEYTSTADGTEWGDIKDLKSNETLAKVCMQGNRMDIVFGQWNVGYKQLCRILKCVCFSNTSVTPNVSMYRFVEMQLVWGPETLPCTESEIVMVPDDEPGYEQCSLGIVVKVEAVDNPTEITLQSQVLYCCAGVVGVEEHPLQVAEGVEVADPDTPVFEQGSVVGVEVLGGGPSDVLDISYAGDDSLTLSGAWITFQQSRVATIKKDTPPKISFELDTCPVEAIELILRRVVYRHMGVAKRVMKKTILLTVKSLVHSFEGGHSASITKVRLTVYVLPPVLEYSAGASCLRQKGSTPVIIVPPGAKISSSQGVELYFELVKAPKKGKYSKNAAIRTQVDGIIPRSFWLPFESLEWITNIRDPRQTDSLQFLPPAEFQAKAVDGGYEVMQKNDKVCTVALPAKELFTPEGVPYDVQHEVCITFPQKLNVKKVLPVLRSVVFQQTVDVSTVLHEHEPEVLIRLRTTLPSPSGGTLTVFDHFQIRPSPLAA